MEAELLDLMRQYGYIILFFWSILEGESGLVMAGLFVHTGDMALVWAITTAGLGAFVGDQLYFYLGRFKKSTSFANSVPKSANLPLQNFYYANTADLSSLFNAISTVFARFYRFVSDLWDIRRVILRF